MYTCQCEGLQMGQSNGVLFKEVSAFWRYPLIEVSLYVHMYVRNYCLRCNHHAIFMYCSVCSLLL